MAAARRARATRRSRSPTTTRSVGLDGVRAGGARRSGLRAIHGAEVTSSTARPSDPAPPHAARARRPRLAQPLPAAHARARAHARVRVRAAASRGARRPRRSRGAATRTSRVVGDPRVTLDDVEEHAEGLVCLSGCARQGVRDEPTLRRLLRAFGPDAFRVELQRPFARHDRALQPRAGRARRPARRPAAWRPATSTRTRPRARGCRTRSSPSASTRRSTPPSRCAAATTRTCSPRREAMAARFADHPEAVAETARLAEHAALRPHAGPRLPLPGRRGRRRRRDAGRGLPRALRGALPARASQLRAPRPPRAWRRSCGLIAEARAVGLLPPAPRPARARARGRRRGPRARHRPRAAAARPRPRVVRVVDRLLPHRPLARRPDRQRAAARALPQRGDHRAAGHRPRLPARRARGPHPARARALRARPLGARRRLPDLPRARRDPRARQGARPAAGGDRARRARLGGLARARTSTATSPPRWASGRERDGPLGVAGRAGRGGPRPAAPPLPALRAG